MKFVDRIKDKVSDTKVKVAVARDRKQVREMVSRLSSLPLCDEDDAYFIVENEVREYFGRQDCFALDLDSNPTEEEKEAEFENLKILRGQMQVFLEFLFDPSLQYSPAILKGSINARFHLKVLQYLDETQLQIDEAMYVAIIESMIAEGSGADMQACFTDDRISDSKIDLFTWFKDYNDNFFPNNSFIRSGRTAQEKLSRYIEREKISAPWKKDGEVDWARLGNPPVGVALELDAIGYGQTITYVPMFDKEPMEMYVGQASVVRMIDYHTPFMLDKTHVFSLRNLSIGIKAEASLDLHFCEDGIIETKLDLNAKPGWIPANKVKELVFGEGYDGMSKDGVTQFERYYLYVIVRTSIGPTFTLYKYLAQSAQKAMEAWADLGEESLPMLADYYNIKISEEVHDVSNHYKTTYTTYTTTWAWE
jgi:hypothetical protein